MEMFEQEKLESPQRNGSNVTVHVFKLSVPSDRPDVCHRVSCPAAAGVLPHAAGLAFRLRSLPGTLRLCHRAAVVVEEVCVARECVCVCVWG